MSKKQPTPEFIAAIDLGSNSFHMIVSRLHNGQLVVVDKLREMVRLADGITEDKNLLPHVAERALVCLERFGQRLKDFPYGSVRAVGTNTLRNASQAGDFLIHAEKALGHPIHIITGVEEARLIYLGVSHGIAEDSEQRLVMDIGGGSTELIIGQAFNPRYMESLEMGCVSITRRFFYDGKITAPRIQKALLAASSEVAPHAKTLKQFGWKKVIGASGSIRAVRSVLLESGWCNEGISIDGLRTLVKSLTDFKNIKDVVLPGLSAERAPVFLGGALVLLATFEKLKIKQMVVSNSALREGLIHDLQGRIEHEDSRTHSVANLMERYHVDKEQAKRVETSALYIQKQLKKECQLNSKAHKTNLIWAAQLHEIGLDIAHKHYHRHGSYIIKHSDLAGFSQQEQQRLACVVRLHRRKCNIVLVKELPERLHKSTAYMVIILRLAFILNRSRSNHTPPEFTISIQKKNIQICFQAQWLAKHPLTQTDLTNEVSFLAKSDFILEFK